MNPRPARPGRGWHQRARHALATSLRLKLMLVFLVLALGLSAAFLGGSRRAFGAGWQDIGRPLVTDYLDRLAAQIGSPPDVRVAAEIAQRLPLSLRISGPQVQWASHLAHDAAHRAEWYREPDDEPRFLVRHSADGHRIEFGLQANAWRGHPRRIGWWTLAALLVLTLAAYAYLRRLLRPIDEIRAGAARFAQGQFGQPIAVHRGDELGELAAGVNTMARELHAMLEAKRGLLLAISHELRSPLTRARLNTELLPNDKTTQAAREALLRDLNLMRDLITDLLEGERLSQGHAALHLEPTDAAALVREVVGGLQEQADGVAAAAAAPSPSIGLDLAADLPLLRWDRMRMRLLLRNLLGNALRHGQGQGVCVALRLMPDTGYLELAVRDHGPGVAPALLDRLAEPFFRADSARERATGGVGLGLHLCRLVAQAHGGRLVLSNAQPGLLAQVLLPATRS